MILYPDLLFLSPLTLLLILTLPSTGEQNLGSDAEPIKGIRKESSQCFNISPTLK